MRIIIGPMMILQVINYNLIDKDVRSIFDVEAHNTVHATCHLWEYGDMWPEGMFDLRC